MLKLDTLEEKQRVKVKVLTIVDKNKIVNCKEGTCYKYEMTFAEWVEPDNKFIPCDRVFEYLSKTKQQEEFMAGLAYWIEGGYPDSKGQRIFRSEAPQVKNAIIEATQATLNRPPANDSPQKEKTNINLSGQSVTFAMAYAKDILVAEIRAGGQFTFEQQMDYLEERSAAINQIMVKQVQG